MQPRLKRSHRVVDGSRRKFNGSALMRGSQRCLRISVLHGESLVVVNDVAHKVPACGGPLR